MSEATAQAAPKLFAILELFGHQRVAGAISEQNFGGANLVRVDVPEITVRETDYSSGEAVKVTRLIQSHTRSFGAGAIYSVNWCDEETATRAAESIRHEPLRTYAAEPRLAHLPDEHRTRLLAHDVDDDDNPF